MGDPLQLPPVSDSMELSESFDVESKTLSQIMRYDGIISDAVAMPRNALIDNVLDRNMLPGAGGTPESFVELHKGAPFKDRVMELVRAGEDVKIIAYTNRTVDALNRVVRRELYGGDVEDYLVGERLVANESYVVNDSIVLYNEQQVEVMEAERSPFHSPDFTASVWKLSLKADDGSTCQVLTVAPEDMGAYNKALAQLKAKAIKKRNWKDFYALKEQFAWLKPPFACTVHKSQGSSFKYCAVDYSDIMGTTRYDLNMRARLLYVAYSRAMNGLIIKH